MIHVVGRGRVGLALAQSLPGSQLHSGRDFRGISGLTPQDTVLLAVPDAAIAGLSKLLEGSQGVRLHCAGSVALHDLGAGSCGVFYPMVSFQTSPNWAEVPIFAEASDSAAKTAIEALGALLGCPPAAWTDSKKRAQYHLGAVFANNFSNHVIALLQSYCAQTGLNPHAYEAMVRSTLEAAEAGDAKSMQTGPASRADQITLDRHMDLLPKELRSIYRALSQSIQGTLP